MKSDLGSVDVTKLSLSLMQQNGRCITCDLENPVVNLEELKDKKAV